MLIDRATIFVRSGKGGNGCMSFRREKFVPKGGPDGGDGGRGGDVTLVADASLSTLLPLTPRPHYRAANGRPGMGKSKHGADGDDLEVRVPVGTLVFDADSAELLADLSEPGERYVAARGGRGGLGNEHFKSSTNQAPREVTPGEPCIDRTLRLELKLIADVGLVGRPNAGKSTLLRQVSKATPKIADYPFTTLRPHLGTADLPDERRLIVADIPGLIEGAAEGAGLGHDFLRHIERTGVIVHVIDVAPVDESDPVEGFRVIEAELAGYSPALAAKPRIVALNKIDLLPAGERATRVERMVAGLALPEGTPVHLVSGATGEGVAALLEACWALTGRPASAAGWSSPPAAR
ncbi:MAG: GTPase ObgE [Planctomycetota bacterium]|jgi:GTP-binding protein